MTASICFESSGPMTTVQSLGRFGTQALGIPVAGALDPIALRLANALVGNTEDEAGLELRFMGPRIRIQGEPVRVALVGTSSALEVLEPDPFLVPSGQSVTLQPGQVFRVGLMRDTSCCVLAVAGGFELPAIFGSLSTYVPGGFGGLSGRLIVDGDEIAVAGRAKNDRGDLRLEGEYDSSMDSPIRVVLGPQDDYFTADAVETFLSSPYVISPESNRMGLRLAGVRLEHAKGYNIPSDGIATGAIQVPGTGLPIVLMADRQTTGGYPKIATVISADLPRLGRALPGQEIHFSAVKVDEAVAIRRQQEAAVQDLIKGLKSVSIDASQLQHLLMSENLISGAVWG